MAEQEYFKKALSDFTFEFAGGNAIRKFARQDYSVEEIAARLDYPVPKSKIADIVWKEYLSTGKVCMELPETDGMVEKVTYVKEQSANGRVSMRQVVEKIEVAQQEYILINFGKMKYQKKAEFMKALDKMSVRDRSYICDINWPLTDVYHVRNEQIERILGYIGSGASTNNEN